MKGVLFNVTEDVVSTTLGHDAWDAALDQACLAGVYTSLGDYSDSDLEGIVAAISSASGLMPTEVLRHVGRHGYQPLVRRQPELVAGIEDLGELLHRLDGVIHPEVLKLYPQARPPSFQVTDRGPGQWSIVYGSQRRLCPLAEGLLEGAAASFGDEIAIEQPECMLRDDARCTLDVRIV